MIWYNAIALLLAVLFTLDFIAAVILHYMQGEVKPVFNGKIANMIGVGCLFYILMHFGYLTLH